MKCCELHRFPKKYLYAWKEGDKQYQMFISEELYQQIRKLQDENPGSELSIKAINNV